MLRLELTGDLYDAEYDDEKYYWYFEDKFLKVIKKRSTQVFYYPYASILCAEVTDA